MKTTLLRCDKEVKNLTLSYMVALCTPCRTLTGLP